VDGLVAWLDQLPLAVLYVSMCVIAAAENIFPPLPADTVVAIGAWLAARGDGNVMSAFLSTWVGNVAGATGMYLIGRAHGAGWMRRRFPQLADERNGNRIRALYGKYGVAALVVSRFIPGVRALVPPVAGALHVPPLAAISAMAIASAIWYGGISYVAFTAGADWKQLVQLVQQFGLQSGIVATSLVLIAGAVWVVRRRRQNAASSSE
jgi:membrane protein DedA with SNARE-associated domain